GQRPVYGGTKKFQTDPHWKDHLLFYEYFHGDNGAGLGANHQTGWTGLVATMIELFGRLDGPHFLEMGRAAAFARRKVEGSLLCPLGLDTRRFTRLTHGCGSGN